MDNDDHCRLATANYKGFALIFKRPEFGADS